MSRKFSVLAIASLLLVSASTANAQTPFASFNLANPNTQPFEYTNAGAASTFGLYGANSVVGASFTYQTANGYGAAQVPIAANMTFTSDTNGTVSVFGNTVVQALKNINITFTALTPVNGLANLLTVYLSEGVLLGTVGGNTLSLQATEPPLAINYSSDFLNFSGPFTNKNYSIAITGTVPAIEVDANDYLKSFKAIASGDFASDPVPPKIPEPGTMALLALGAVAGVVARRRK